MQRKDKPEGCLLQTFLLGVIGLTFKYLTEYHIWTGNKMRGVVEHLMDALLRGKTLERFQSYQLGLQNGVFSPNEIREFENLNPFEGGDSHLQQMNMTPYGTTPPPDPRRVVRQLERTETGYTLTEQEDIDG